MPYLLALSLLVTSTAFAAPCPHIQAPNGIRYDVFTTGATRVSSCPAPGQSSELDRIDTTLTSVRTGEIVAEVSNDTPIRRRMVYRGEVPNGDVSELTFFPVLSEEGALMYPEDAEEFSAGLVAEGTPRASTTTYSFWVRPMGRLNSARVAVGSRTGADVSNVVGMNVLNAEGELFSLDFHGLKEVFESPVPADSEGNLVMNTSFIGTDGSVLVSEQRTVFDESQQTAPKLGLIQLRETRRGQTRINTRTTALGQTSLQLTLTDSETGEVVLEHTQETPSTTSRQFVSQAISFDPGESPADYVYLVLIDRLGANGDPVGTQREIEFTVPPFDPEDGEPGISEHPFGEGEDRGIVTVIHDADGIRSVVRYAGSDATDTERIALIFEEPFEGPAPLETEVSVETDAQFDTWSTVGGGLVPGNYTITATLLDAEGQVLDATSTTGSGPGTVFKTEGNGCGTRKAVSTGQHCHLELL